MLKLSFEFGLVINELKFSLQFIALGKKLCDSRNTNGMARDNLYTHSKRLKAEGEKKRNGTKI